LGSKLGEESAADLSEQMREEILDRARAIAHDIEDRVRRVTAGDPNMPGPDEDWADL
jgi:hypothetical protein